MKIVEYYLDQNKHKKHLIFDLDETLAWLKIDWSGFRNYFFDFARDFDPEFVDSVVNESGAAQSLYNELILKHGYHVKKEVDKFCKDWELSMYKGHVENEPLVKFIRENEDKYDMFVWTNQNRVTATKTLNELKILDLFDLVIAKENENVSKPYPDGFYQIFDADIHNRSDFLLIGDSTTDAVAALRAGIDFLRIKMEE